MSSLKRFKTILMNKTLREATNLCVEIMNSKRRVNEKLSHVVHTNSGLPFDVNVKFNLSAKRYFYTDRCI